MPLKIEVGISEKQVVPGDKKLTERDIAILNRLLGKEIGTEKQRNALIRIMQSCAVAAPARPAKFPKLIAALKQQTGRSTL